MPLGQSECSPEGQGSEQVEAASFHEWPHMKESRSWHDVWGWHAIPVGQSRLNPDGHGREQLLVASSKLAPQKAERSPGPAGTVEVEEGSGSSTSQVVWAKQVRFPGQSLDRPEGQGVSQVPPASMKLFPQKKEPLSAHVVKAKQLIPVGQSPLLPVGHGYSHIAEASLMFAPQ